MGADGGISLSTNYKEGRRMMWLSMSVGVLVTIFLVALVMSDRKEN